MISALEVAASRFAIELMRPERQPWELEKHAAQVLKELADVLPPAEGDWVTMVAAGFIRSNSAEQSPGRTISFKHVAFLARCLELLHDEGGRREL